MKTPLKIAFTNAKGGTAKTSSTQNVAHALASKKKKVLCIDFDPQASLTCSFGYEPDDCEVSIADVLLENVPINEAIVKTSVDGVDLVCGSLHLSSFDMALGDEEERESKLKRALSEVEGYDYILVDTSPSASLLMVNTILGVDRYVIPVTPEYLAVKGLATMIDIIDRVRGGYGENETASLMGIVLTKVDRRNTSTKELIELIRNQFKGDVFKSEIGINVRVAEASSHGKTVFQHDWASTGAQNYRNLADEIIKRSKEKK